jgi:PhzF family phenazine biosynthesis protein
MTTKTPIYCVDAFTDQPFTGNPAAVCLLDHDRDEGWMQSLAAEMNLSETAFVLPHNDEFGLRWFTPKVEVDLCGHATLASAHVLWTTGVTNAETIRFNTRSGALLCTRLADRVAMNFPAISVEPIAPIEKLVSALGAEVSFVGTSATENLLAVVSEDALLGMEPNLALLRQMPAHGVIVTSPSADPKFDFLSRYFAPAVGIDEDPVTGSTHCCLGPFWGERLKKTELVGFQASSRGGVVNVSVLGDRVSLGGQAVTVLEGHLSNG